MVIPPSFLRTVGRWRANDWSFGLSHSRGDIPEGTFGHVAPFWCDDCGAPCGEPEYHMTYRQTLEQPEEGVECCPECGSEDCGDHDPRLALQRIGEYRLVHRV